jgi:hypothetical protein
MSIKWQDKDPDDQVDYSIDWTNILETHTISSVAWKIYDATTSSFITFAQGDIVNGLQHVSNTNTDTVATLYLGLGTNFQEYNIICRMTTSNSTVFEQEARIRVVEKN